MVTVSNEDLQWSRGGLGNGGGLGGRQRQSASTSKPDTKTAAAADAPKPDTDSTKTADAHAKTADAKAPDTKPDLKRFSPTVGKTMTQLGVPPSAVRAIKAGEPIKGIKGLTRGQFGAGQHIAGKLGDKAGARLAEKGLQGLGKGGIKVAARLLPGVGSVYAGYAAFKDFKSGDYVGAALNAFGVIPGPVGWISMGLAAGWDIIKPHKTFGMWAQPDGTNTSMLPAEAKDVAGVKESDAALHTAQNGVLSFQDGPTGTVWNESPPEPLRLDTAEVVAAATEWLSGISEHFAEIDRVMLQAGEQAFNEQRQPLVPHFTAVAKLKTQVKDLTDQLTASSAAAETGYRAVLDTNKTARTQLSTDGTLSDHGPATVMKTKLQNAQAQIAAADDKLTKLFSESPPAIVEARTVAVPGTRTAPQETKPVATPAPVSPSIQPATTAPTKTEAPTKSNDDLSKLLSQLGQQAKAATPTSTNPLGTGSGLGVGSPLGTGTGGGTGGGTPLSSSKPDTSEKKDEGKKLGDDKKLGERKTEEPKKLDDKSLSGAKPEQAKAAVPGAEAKPAVPAPGVVAPAAPSPAQQNVAHAAAQAEPSKEVDVKGQKTVFPDAKTAKLAQILAAADPTHPVSLADAAAQAGLTPPVPGQDPGKQVSPADAKPGDIMVAGDKSYMLLGDGKFYDLADYKIVGASELPQQLGDRAGYFHLNDPNPNQAPGQTGEQAPTGAPAPAQPAGPVSPQSTSGVQHPVPNATGAPIGPVDANAPGGQPAAPSGVPSTGTPGVPKPGAPGAGSSNAESTNTGTSVPSSSPGSLDPGAIK